MMGHDAPAAIRIRRLSKRFPLEERLLGLLPSRRLGPPAVDAVSLDIHEGELFGLLGPNGAGKTTLVKMLATLIVPTSGSARICGRDLHDEAAVKAVCGLVTTDERSFYWRLSGRRNLAFFGSLHQLPDLEPRIEQTLALVGLEEAAARPFKEYSTGMRQRLAIARALLHRPRVLFLDEPTRGLDPPGIRALQALIRDLTRVQGLTVLMTTHMLHEAEALCDRLAVLHEGRLRGVGTADELRGLTGSAQSYRVHVAGGGAESFQWPEGVRPEGEGTWRVEGDRARLNRALDAVRAAGAEIESARRVQAPLETVFERLVVSGGSGASTDELLLEPDSHSGSLEKVDRPGFFQVARAVLSRDWQSERSYRLAFLLNFGGILFSAAVFFYVARLIDSAAAPYLGQYGGSYFSFVLMGIAMQRYFGAGLSGFSSAFRQAQTTGTLEAMLTTPARLGHLVLASSLWSYGLVSLQVVLYILVGVVFLGVELHADWPAALLASALGVASYAGLGILSAGFIMVLKRGDPVTWLVSAVSTFFGGVYFPVELLPGWLRPFSALLPLTYGLRAVRAALLQGKGIGEIGGDLLALALFCALLLPAGLLAFRWAVGRAREDGSLTHY